MATNIGTGSTITFGTSSFSADILDIQRTGIARGAIETTHMGTTGGQEFMPTDLYNPGEVEVEFAWIGSLDPPYDGAIETVTINCAGAGSGHNWASSAFCTNFEYGLPLEEKMTGRMTLKCTGDITQN